MLTVDWELLERIDAIKYDDRDAYSSLIERTDYRLDISRDEQIRAREDVQKAFNYYHRRRWGMVTISEQSTGVMV